MKYPIAELVGTPRSLFSVTILDSIKQNIKDAKSLTIVTGYITEAGWKLLNPAITAALKRKCLVRLFSDSSLINTDYSLLFKLNKVLNKKSKNFYGMVFDGPNIKMLHAKFLIFDKPRNKSVIIVGSANITYPALSSNLELGIQLETQTNSDFYKKISPVLETLEKYSHEPTEEENNYYLKNKQQIEEKRSLQTRFPGLRRQKKDKKIFDVKEFRNNIKQDFNDPQLINDIQRLSKQKVGSEQDNTGKAITNFTKLVLENKEKFSQIDNFKLMLRIYANILDYSSKKPSLENLLTEDLQSRIKVKENAVNQISSDSIPGRYLGLTRGVREPYKIKPTHIEAILDLINKFYDGTDYEMLLNTFITFDKKTKKMKPRGIGLVTGVLAALKPNLFVVCNRRTRTLRKISKQAKYKGIFSSKSFENYPKFNEIFRYLSERAGISDLRKLDLISSEIYEQLKR